ncbi:MAG: alkaline phosphatase D family protein [Pirellula sp.]
MRSLIGCLLAVCECLNGLSQDGRESEQVKPISAVVGLPKRIAFGSCAHQDKPQPVLKRALEQAPDIFIYLGDNIYGDSRDMGVLREKYAKLASKPEFILLRKNIATLSIWDDHDYGENDAGKEYPFHRESRELFLDFWKVPKDSQRRTHEGIYGSHMFRSNNQSLQIILLDTRSFRSPLKRNPFIKSRNSEFKNDYQPDADPTKTILGETQWKWLEEQLRAPADVRIIASSIQFAHEYNGYESWNNLPLEQQRMIETIRRTKASGVLFLSGDVHWAEISRRNFPDLYPLYDVTASGITETWYKIEPNSFRVGQPVPENHFGLLEFEWDAAIPNITLKIINHNGETKCRERIDQAELRFEK